MKNGIIIDGQQYEVQDISKKLKGTETDCDVCDLEEKCDTLGRTAMCVILHGARHHYVYKAIGKEEEK